MYSRCDSAFASKSCLIKKDDDDDLNSDKFIPALKNDRKNIALLLLLYMLQGVPLGLTASIPMILQNRGVSFTEQAEFSLAYWPFSMKLMWAPIVDSIFSKRFGKRKSWLIPTQLLLGIVMLVMSTQISKWIGQENPTVDDLEYDIDITALTIVFSILNFLAATQDIVVDGWAITMLNKKSVGHTSTCNTIGQMTGYYLGFVVFISLESSSFCNSYLRVVPEDDGLITLSGYLKFWGIVFLVCTIMIAAFKRERHNQSAYILLLPDIENTKPRNIENSSGELSIKQTYKILLQVIRIRPVRLLCAALLTEGIMFAACDAVSSLKLIETGFSKDTAAILSGLLLPVQILLPIFINKQTASSRPLDLCLKAYPFRIMFTIMIAITVWIASVAKSGESDFPIYFYIFLIVNYSMYQCLAYTMYVTEMGFFARISDPILGGTYMTMMNTVCNMGGMWPSYVALSTVDTFSWSRCEFENSNTTSMNSIHSNSCYDDLAKDICYANGGSCEKIVDGFYLQSVLCVLIGIAWYKWVRPKFQYLQNLEPSAWHVVQKNN